MEGKFVLLILYVDDMLIAGNDREKLDEIKNKLKEVFKMTDLGEPKVFLGMNIERNRVDGVMNVHQSKYIEQILERFNMKDCKPQSTPIITRQVANRENT